MGHTKRNPSREFKIYTLQNLQELKKELRLLQEENMRLKSLDELLTINEIEQEFKVSRKTIDRWRGNGLSTSQIGYGKLIRIKRGDIVDFLNKRTKL